MQQAKVILLITDFDNKLSGFNKRINSNKSKHVLVENELNELSNKVKTISTKRLTKDLITEQDIFPQEHYKII